MIDERLLELFDWETIFSNDQRDQDQLDELEDIAAIEQPALVQEEVEKSQHNHLIEVTEEEGHIKLDKVESNSTTHLFDSILYKLHQMPQNGVIDHSAVITTQEHYHEDQKEPQQ